MNHHDRQRTTPGVELLEDRTVPTSLVATGSGGINLLGLNLSGNGVRVGQIEAGRPGLVDHPLVRPFAVFDGALVGGNNPNAVYYDLRVPLKEAHATQVASVIKALPLAWINPWRGIAYEAELYSAAGVITPGREAEFNRLMAIFLPVFGRTIAFQLASDEASVRTIAQALENLGSKGLSALNMSFESNRVNNEGGAAREALMVDYFSRTGNYLPVVAGPNVDAESDQTRLLSSYNSLKVAALALNMNKTAYEKVGSAAPASNDTRSLIDVAAPGDDIPVATFDSKTKNPTFVGTGHGTSIAVPFVTGSIANLTQYIRDHKATVAQIAQQSFVLKSIILNSADKFAGRLPDAGGANKMSRTLFDGLFGDWDSWDDVKDVRDADADTTRSRQEHPLNPEFGAGGLNVTRAVVQINGGQGGRPLNQPNAPLGPIGWDGSVIENAAAYQFTDSKNGQILRRPYDLPQLKPGEYLSVTVAWERPVMMRDAQGKALPADAKYQPGNQFDAGVFNAKPPNLDLYLVKKGATTTNDAVWASTSKESNVEHFFFQMPDAKDAYHSANGYELWVVSREQQTKVNYGIAWWGVAAKAGGGGMGNKGISGYAWDDTNGNGLRRPEEAASEPVRTGVRVALLDANQNEIDSVTTDWQGNYQFDVPDGKYYIQVTRPATHDFTVANMNPDDQDSDAVPVAGSPSLGRTGEIVVAGADVGHVDVGFVAVPLGTVSGRAFNDTNADGIQAGEGGFAGARVELHRTDGTPTGSAVTGADGTFTFAGVAPGEYVLYAEKPANAALSPKDVGSDATDSDFDPDTRLTAPFAVASGGSAVRDVGLRNVAGSVAGRVYFDADEDGTQDAGEDGIADQTVTVRNSVNAVVGTTATGADGSYRFDGLAPGTHTVEVTPAVYWNPVGSPTQSVTVGVGTTATANAGLKFTTSTGLIAGRVWTDGNGNGLRETGEAVRAGVMVELRQPGTATVVATALTDANGDYAFAWVAPGTYDVRVVGTETGTARDAGTDDTIDSDFAPATRTAAGVQVAAWQLVEHLDAGLLVTPNPATVGGRAFRDLNGNGTEDAGETGVASVPVFLLDTGGNTVGWAVTAADGTYQLGGLAAGPYRLRFVLPPEYPGASFAAKDVGGNDAIDSDPFPDGHTDFFSLAPGAAQLDWDAGLLGIPIETPG